MRCKSLVLLCLLVTAAAYGKELKAYQDGALLQMDSVQCGVDTKDAKKGKSHDLLCQEYVVQTEQVVYRVREKNEKHPVLLPVGEKAEFRLDKLKMMLRVPGFDGKEREFVVVSVKPRGDNSADASAVHVNHVQ
jgi:hypothetical protein